MLDYAFVISTWLSVNLLIDTHVVDSIIYIRAVIGYICFLFGLLAALLSSSISSTILYAHDLGSSDLQIIYQVLLLLTSRRAA